MFIGFVSHVHSRPQIRRVWGDPGRWLCKRKLSNSKVTYSPPDPFGTSFSHVSQHPNIPSTGDPFTSGNREFKPSPFDAPIAPSKNENSGDLRPTLRTPAIYRQNMNRSVESGRFNFDKKNTPELVSHSRNLQESSPSSRQAALVPNLQGGEQSLPTFRKNSDSESTDRGNNFVPKYQNQNTGSHTGYRGPFWTHEERALLVESVAKEGKNWKLISEKHFKSKRSPTSVEIAYERKFSHFPPWSSEEIQKLMKGVEEYGENFELISSQSFNSSRSTLACQKKFEYLMNNKGLEQKLPQSRSQGLPWKSKETQPNTQKEPKYQDSLETRLGDILDKKLSEVNNAVKKPIEKIHVRYDTPVASKKPWTKEENETLFQAVKEFGEDWGKILERLPGRTLASVRYRYGDIYWTVDEAEAFEKAVSIYKMDWAKIAEHVRSKTAGQCWSYWLRSSGQDLKAAQDIQDASENPQRVQLMVLLSDEKPLTMNFVRHHKWETFTLESEMTEKIEKFPIVSGKGEETATDSLKERVADISQLDPKVDDKKSEMAEFSIN
ncbi:hypothetical protein G9A89_006129 [Geosiphon pyriformis]|nr:hypothetical protein G9A89_006129 [Geosiphon pyriformis]